MSKNVEIDEELRDHSKLLYTLKPVALIKRCLIFELRCLSFVLNFVKTSR